MQQLLIPDSRFNCKSRSSDFEIFCLGRVPRGSDGSRTIMESRMSGPSMTSTLASSVPTCATDTAGAITDTAG